MKIIQTAREMSAPVRHRAAITLLWAATKIAPDSFSVAGQDPDTGRIETGVVIVGRSLGELGAALGHAAERFEEKAREKASEMMADFLASLGQEDGGDEMAQTIHRFLAEVSEQDEDPEPESEDGAEAMRRFFLDGMPDEDPEGAISEEHARVLNDEAEATDEGPLW